jgi:hypothetical protein
MLPPQASAELRSARTREDARHSTSNGRRGKPRLYWNAVFGFTEN